MNRRSLQKILLGVAWVGFVFLGSSVQASQDWQAKFLGKEGLKNASFEGGLLALKNGDLEKAQEHFEEVVTLRENSIEANFLLGQIAAFQGRNEDAVDSFSRVLEINPYYMPAHFALASFYVILGDLEKAKDQLVAAKKIYHPKQAKVSSVDQKAADEEAA
jgi:tetratricopeptide (TPR) repeat protein